MSTTQSTEQVTLVVPNILTITDVKGKRLSIDTRYVTRVSETERSDQIALELGAKFALAVATYYPSGRTYGSDRGDSINIVEFNTQKDMSAAHDLILKAQEDVRRSADLRQKSLPDLYSFEDYQGAKISIDPRIILAVNENFRSEGTIAETNCRPFSLIISVLRDTKEIPTNEYSAVGTLSADFHTKEAMREVHDKILALQAELRASAVPV